MLTHLKKINPPSTRIWYCNNWIVHNITRLIESRCTQISNQIHQLHKITVCFVLKMQLLQISSVHLRSNYISELTPLWCYLAEFKPHFEPAYIFGWKHVGQIPSQILSLRRSEFAQEFNPHSTPLSPRILPSLPSEHHTGWILGESIRRWAATLPSLHKQLQPTLLWPEWPLLCKSKKRWWLHTHQPVPRIGSRITQGQSMLNPNKNNSKQHGPFSN